MKKEKNNTNKSRVLTPALGDFSVFASLYTLAVLLALEAASWAADNDHTGGGVRKARSLNVPKIKTKVYKTYHRHNCLLVADSSLEHFRKVQWTAASRQRTVAKPRDATSTVGLRGLLTGSETGGRNRTSIRDGEERQGEGGSGRRRDD